MRRLITFRSLIALATVTVVTVSLALSWDRYAPRVAAQSACAQPPSGMVSWWPAGNHTFDIQDGNHAALLGGAFYSAAKVGPGFAFDSDDDRVTVPHNNNLNINSPGFTAEFWMRGIKNQPQTIYNLVEKSHGFIDNTGWSFQGTSATGTVGFGVVAGGPGFTNFPGVGTGIDVLDGSFHHIAGTWDGTHIRLYVDGVLQGATPLATPFNNTRAMNIGFAWGGGTAQRFFRGMVDELSVYSRALTASEIQSVFNTGSAGKCKPFIAGLDNKGGFLRADSDNPAAPLIVDLASAGFAPGEQIKVRFAAQGFSFFGCGGPFATLSQIGINAVFSNSTTLLSPPNQFRVPGAIDAGIDIFTGNTHFGGQPTNISQDFLVAHTTGTVVQIPSGAAHLFVGLIDSYYQDNCGNFLIFIERVKRAPVAACQNVTVSAGANCTADASIDNGSSDPDGNAITLTQSPAGPYALGSRTVTLTVTDSNGASSSCSAIVTVVDSTLPQVTPPANASYQCLSNVPPGNPSQATATDNCSTPTITVADAGNGGAGSIASPLVITRYFTATDAAGNSASAAQIITVVDNQQPVIVCQPNIALDGNILGSCGANVSLITPAATDNCGVTSITGARSDGQSLNAAYPSGLTTITWTAMDAAGNSAWCQQTVTVTNPLPVVMVIGPPTGSVYAVNTPVCFTGSFTDNPGGAHTATWTFDSLSSAGAVNEATGAVTGSYTFTAAGVYKATLTVMDGCGGTGSANTIDGLDLLVVIYDPSAGWVTGGGWINSPAGAYVPNPSLTGKANFGFVSKYHNGATVPLGNTEFQFKAGNLNFSSASYEWLVIAGARAQYKGSGKINGAGSYDFMLTAIDGQQPGGGGADKFRIRIWDRTNGGLIYDNQLNAPNSDDPTTTLGGGNIVIHK